MKNFYKRIVIMPVLFMLAFAPCFARADDGYAKHKDGTAGVEIGISEGNMLMLRSEKLSLDFMLPNSENAGLGDDLYAKTHAVYEIFNSDTRDAYAAIGVVRMLKVKAVEIKRSEENSFRSGDSIIVNDETANGLIYPVDTPEKILKNSAYDSLTEGISHMEFGDSFEEAFARYGITSFTDHEERLGDAVSKIPKSEYRKLYQVDDEGEEMLCIVVYNLHFAAQETKMVEVSRDFMGMMERPTTRSELGTTFSFVYNGNNLKTFYSVSEVLVSLNVPKDERLGLIECDAPYYLNDGVHTIRYAGPFSEFTVKLGKEADEDEIYDQLLERGFWRRFVDAVGTVTLVGVIISAVYIGITIRKRRKSGIGVL